MRSVIGVIRPRCKEVAKELKDARHCFVLGKGFGEAVAMEGALKLKEMSYLHAEGYSGGALKHGPFALLEVCILCIDIGRYMRIEVEGDVLPARRWVKQRRAQACFTKSMAMT